MPQIIKPSDVMTRLKAGETPRHIFFDAGGARPPNGRSSRT